MLLILGNHSPLPETHFFGLVLGHCSFLILLHHNYLQISCPLHFQSNSKSFVFFYKILEQFHPHAHYKPLLICYNFNSLYFKLQTSISNYLLSIYLNIFCSYLNLFLFSISNISSLYPIYLIIG